MTALLAAVIQTPAAFAAGDAKKPEWHGPAILFEPATGRVLFSDSADQSWYPASLTKLMTAYVVFEAVRNGEVAWQDTLKLSEYARSQPATRVGLRAGIDVDLSTAVRALIIRSANDFAVALGETISGSEAAFVERMNRTARRLGMAQTTFTNPHGLPDPLQVSTARDLALLSGALIRDFPEHADVFGNPEVAIRKLVLRTHNDLLRTFDGADGMKTGFTCSSGYNIVASATRNGRQLVVVVLGALTGNSRSQRARELLEHGFATADWKEMGAPRTLASLPVEGTAGPLDLARRTRTWKCGNGRPPSAIIAKQRQQQIKAKRAAAAKRKVSQKASAAQD